MRKQRQFLDKEVDIGVAVVKRWKLCEVLAGVGKMFVVLQLHVHCPFLYFFCTEAEIAEIIEAHLKYDVRHCTWVSDNGNRF